MGFNVVVAGVALTFKGEPFGPMGVIRYWVDHDPQAKVITVTTKCAFCDRPAEVTKLTKDGKMADYHDPNVFVGDSEFTPVDGVVHTSVQNRPEPFTGYKGNLCPEGDDYYRKILAEAGVQI